MRNDIDKIDALRYTVKALKKLIPDAQINIKFPEARFDYSGIEIVNGYELPSEELLLQTIDDVYDETIAELTATEYQRLRAVEYPDFKDYLDGVVKGDQAQIQAYIDACLAVKAKYPKP